MATSVVESGDTGRGPGPPINAAQAHNSRGRFSSKREAEGMVDLGESTVYREHRIHTLHLPSGLWLATIVNFGKRKTTTTNSLTAAVTRIPREYDSEEEAIQAAKYYIDQQEEKTH
jgi:hypothetical protein